MGRRCKAVRSSVCEASCIDSLSFGAVVGSQIEPDKASYVEKHSGSSKINRAYQAGSIKPCTRASSKSLLSRVDRATCANQIENPSEQSRSHHAHKPAQKAYRAGSSAAYRAGSHAQARSKHPDRARQREPVNSGSLEAAQSSQPGRLARSSSKSLLSRATRRLSSSLARLGLLQAA